MRMKRVLVGGPFLGRSDEEVSKEDDSQKLPCWNTFPPLVAVARSPASSATAASGMSFKTKEHRLVLLPTSRFITVLSYKTGKRLATLLPGRNSNTNDKNNDKKSKKKNDPNNNNNNSLIIESVVLAKYPRSRSKTIVTTTSKEDGGDDDDKNDDDAVFLANSSPFVGGDNNTDTNTDHAEMTVLLVGMRDGTLCEFALDLLADAASASASLSSSSTNNLPERTSNNNCGPFRIPGPCLAPRRILRVADADQPILHLAVVDHVDAGSSENAGDATTAAVVYAIVGDNKHHSGQDSYAAELDASLVRIAVPSFSPSKTSTVSKRTTTIVDVRRQTTTSGASSVVVLNKAIQKSLENVKKDDSSSTTSHQSAPFSLLASNSQSQRKAVFVMIASPASLCVYHDKPFEPSSVNNNGERCSYVSFPAPSSTNLLSAVCVSDNGNDVALGHVNGDIRIMNNLLPMVEDYLVAMAHYTTQIMSKTTGTTTVPTSIEKPQHPSKTAVIARRLHWHAHPVASLAFYDSGGGGGGGNNNSNNSVLYSGGDESVLVTWQLSRGSYKPADVLPRLALGGILHIVSVAAGAQQQQQHFASGILVYCADNSLQLFESHNKVLVWKVQGLAAQESLEILPSQPMVRVDSSSSNSGSGDPLVFTGLPRAPGYIHWYDTRSQQVVSSLEVAPFNRISRTGKKDSAMPTPSITHAEWSKTSSNNNNNGRGGGGGGVLVTVDVVPTENTAMGSLQELLPKKKGGRRADAAGIVSTIRFWDKAEGSSNNNKYELAAAMAYPHGTDHRVSAVGLSADGMHACTVSNDENAFRLWRKVDDNGNVDYDDKPAGQQQKASWTCQYRIGTPAGFAKFPVGRESVAFSDDSTILAIAYGNMITLWDYHEMTLLSSLRHIDDDDSAVETLQFLSTNELTDVLFSVSARGVAIQSPYGALGRDGWSFCLPVGLQSRICCAVHLPANDVVAIAVYNDETSSSCITFVDATTGKRYGNADDADNDDDNDDENGAVANGIPGKVVSIAAASSDRTNTSSSNWGGQARVEAPLRLYVLTSAGAVLLLDSSHLEDETAVLPEEDENELLMQTLVPRIPLLVELQKSSHLRKRPLVAVNVDEIGLVSAAATADAGKKRLLAESFFAMPTTAAGALPAELPRLSGAFARSFVGRHLQR